MEKIYKFAKRFRFPFNFREDFKSGTVNCFMVSPKKEIIFDYFQDGDGTRIFVGGERVNCDVDFALRHYENILIMKGEFDEQF